MAKLLCQNLLVNNVRICQRMDDDFGIRLLPLRLRPKLSQRDDGVRGLQGGRPVGSGINLLQNE